MNKNNTHLDDLFAAARSEDPVITEKNAGDLLSQSGPMQSAPFIFSTKGIIMSTIGLSVAAVTAYIVLSGSPQLPPAKHVSTTPVTTLAKSAEPEGTVPATIDIRAPRKFITVTRTDQYVLKTLGSVPVKVMPDEPAISTPVKVTGIKPIVITPEKIAKMGITKKDDGTVTFSQKNEKGRIFSMSFPKNSWGIVVGDNEKQITDAPKFAPLIVTDTKGNRRMAQFFGDMNGMKMRAIQMNMRSDYDGYPDSLGNINGIINNALRIEGSMQIGGPDGDMDKLTVGRVDSNELKDMRDGHSEVKLRITKNNQVDITSAENNINSNHNDVHVFVNTETRDIDTTTNGVKKRIVVMNKTIRIDSTLRAAELSLNHAEKELETVMKKLHLNNLDSLNVRMNDLETKMEFHGINMEQTMKEMELLSIKLEHLIPVLVRNSTSEHVDKAEGITYDDGLIFWYDPGKDFTDAVPEATAEIEKSTPPVLHQAVNSVVSTTSIFPNPAREKTMIRFSLSEPRTVGFSIHDLLGKRVAESGSMTGSTSGDYVHEIDVRDLKAGVYLIVLTTDKGEQNIQRLVIEK